MPPDGLLEVGRVGRAHGVRGDVFVHLTTDRVERVASGSRLRAGTQWLTVTRATRSNDRWRVHFEGIDDRGAAEALSGTVLLAEPIDDPDVLWIHELIGSEVIELGGTRRGRCVAVVDNPAADLIEVESGALVPVSFVVSVADGVITIDAPDGLFDLG